MNKKTLYLFIAVMSLISVFVFSVNAEPVITEKDDISAEENELLKAEDDDICFVRGDVNFDGEITAADARLILRFAVNSQKPSDNERIFANLDNDDELTAADARKALRIAVQLDNGAAHISEEELIMQGATCYDVGITANRCVYCGDLFAFGVIPKKEHTGAGWDTLTPASCTETGLREMRCVYCDILMQTEEIPTSNHIYGEVIYKGTRDCTRMREAYRECKICGYIYNFIVSPSAHTYVPTATTPPTCTEFGIEEPACSACGAVKPDSEKQPIAPLGHIAPPYWTISSYPTETEDGLRIKNCTRCGELLYSEIIPKLDTAN